MRRPWMIEYSGYTPPFSFNSCCCCCPAPLNPLYPSYPIPVLPSPDAPPSGLAVPARQKDAANSKAMSTAAAHWGKSEQATSKLRTMTSYCRSSGDVKSVPDPYYGGPQVLPPKCIQASSPSSSENSARTPTILQFAETRLT